MFSSTQSWLGMSSGKRNPQASGGAQNAFVNIVSAPSEVKSGETFSIEALGGPDPGQFTNVNWGSASLVQFDVVNVGFPIVQQLKLILTLKAPTTPQNVDIIIEYTCQSGATATTMVSVAVVNLDLVIYNGQDGTMVNESEEEIVGAFTVANLNDTDGDGIVDNNDDIVTAVNGRNEIDLMQLDIRRPDPDLGGTVNISILSGSVKFWGARTKGVPVTTINFATTTLPRTLWVEATAFSKSVRDIVLESEYRGLKDSVKATAIWADRTKFTNDPAIKVPSSFADDQAFLKLLC